MKVPKPLHWGALTALGIVYGDLGTSPLYTLQTVVQTTHGRFTPAVALGLLSLIIWTLIVTISIKYCLVVMKADNHGEGGILALMSLVGGTGFQKGAKLLTTFGLLGAALIYGDGVITPAISVLSALEGVNVVTASLKPFVLPLAVLILLALFAVQSFGTAKIGSAFGPIMLLWFIVISVLGLCGIVQHPGVVVALDPRLAISFLASTGGSGFLVLGGIFLCITGGEALYADMGHIGKAPIRLSWYFIVLPSLVLSYAGQTALLIGTHKAGSNPFFLLAPSWSVYPLVALATVATVIASQAIITGAFSMTRQAMQLGWLPGFNIQQTSDKLYGQIYVPVVNWLMMLATIAITIGFESSERLAGAYGTAVSTTMLLTTCLLFRAMRNVWHWSLVSTVLVAGSFFIVDACFFGANLLKITEGGWVPLMLGGVVFFIMTTWRSGIDAVKASLHRTSRTPSRLLEDIEAGKIPRVPGTAIFLTRSNQQIPLLLCDQVAHMGALHCTVIALTVLFEDLPRIGENDRCSVELIATGIWHMTVKFGFVEIPNLSLALANCTQLDPSIDLKEATYFGARDFVVRSPEHSAFARWRLPVFAFLYRNAVKMVDRFNLPSQNVVEIARQIEI